MSAVPLPFVSREEYLERERSAPAKSQYVRGEIFPMAGGSPTHNQVAVNVTTALNNTLADRPCIIYPSDQRVATPTGLITYPDASAACGEREHLDDRKDTLLNP